MPKRFTSTEIWEEDWFLEMPNEYKLFWYYMLSNCDHAGIYKVNLRSFSSLLEVKVSSTEILERFNNGKSRIKVVADGVWLIEDFFAYQYGHSFNINNPLHRGVKKQLDKYSIELTSFRGLLEVNLTLKDKDKDKVIKKGGTGENKIRATKFSEDGKFAIFEDGEKQKLSIGQASLLLMKELEPHQVVKQD